MVPYSKQIEKIINNFDFESVAYILQFPIFPTYGDNGEVINRHPWKMFLSDGRFDVPNIDELKTLAKQHLISVSKHNSDSASFVRSGCFKAINWYGTLTLEFVVKEWSSEY